MNGLLEWKKILERNDSIFIFGTGSVGKRLYELMDAYGFADRFKGFVVSRKNENDLEDNAVILEINELKRQGSSAILMSISEAYHPEVYQSVSSLFEETIDAIKYYSLEMPSSKQIEPTVEFADIDLDADKIKIRDAIVAEYFKVKHAFGEDTFYQSLPSLGIKGVRDTRIRIERYDLHSVLLKNQNVLDIGCNCGFFDMEIAQCVSHITALEYDETMSDFSQKTSRLLGVDNISFVAGDFNKWYLENKEKYDVIFSFAVHIWIGMKPEKYADIVYRMLNENGILLFESQDYKCDKKFEDFCKAFTDLGLRIYKEEYMTDDGSNERKIVLLKKDD